MAIIDTNKSPSGSNNLMFFVLRWIIVVMGFFIGLNFIAPSLVAVVLNIIWISLIVLVAIFFGIGVLVVIGLRKEAQRILDILMEGSLSIVDFFAFLKLVWVRFLMLLKEFILFCAPAMAYVLAFILYVILIMGYKQVGLKYDVTAFTIVLTMVLVFLVGVLNRPKDIIPDLSKWDAKVRKVFRDSFLDALEVVLFIFFLTLDSTNLFFLPQELNIELHAEIFGYNLMIPSLILNDHLKITIGIIVAAISLEILRNVLRVAVTARKHYLLDLYLMQDGGIVARKSTRLKKALRKAFYDTKDDLVRFITFTTILFAVFMLLPRLKLLTLGVASVTSLILDMLYTERLTATKGTDLVSRILSKVFKV